MGLFLVSNIASWSYEHGPATVWPPGGFDEWGQPNGAAPYLIPRIGYEGGGRVARDASGVEFVPRQTFRFEANYGDPIVPEREWYIKRGDFTALTAPPSDAEKIRDIRSWPIDELEPGGLPDWEVLT